MIDLKECCGEDGIDMDTFLRAPYRTYRVPHNCITSEEANEPRELDVLRVDAIRDESGHRVKYGDLDQFMAK